MNRTSKLLIGALCLTAVTLADARERPYPGRIALTLVIDTSWTCGDDMSEIRTLGRQAAGCLSFGDSVEILSAHPVRPRIRLAQTAHYGPLSQTNAITRTLAEIRDGFLTDARVSNALKMALDRLDNSFSKQGYTTAVVIVLSDGHLSDSDVGDFLRLAEQFKKRTWPLYITGDRDTNKNLLIAANKGQIHWSSISEANPAMWLQQARESSMLEQEEAVTKQQAEERKEETSRIERPSLSPTADTGKTEPNAPIRETTEPYRTGASPLQCVPKSSPDDVKARFRTELDVTVSGNRSQRGSADVNLPTSLIEKDSTLVVPTEPNSQKETVVSDQSLEEKALPKARPTISARAKRLIGRIWPWLLAACVVPCAALGYLVAGDHRQARIWAIKRKIGFKDKHSDDGMVVAAYNGRTYHLGMKSRLPAIYVGSGVNNTIRTPEKGISDRHLRIYCQGPNLMIQNIGATPVTVSDRPLTPKTKQRLILPAIVELTKNTKLTLSLLRPKDTATSERSKDYEQSKQV
jgi:hypothetical protein